MNQSELFASHLKSSLNWKTLENVKSPVKIQNFQKPAKDVLLNRFTKIKPIEKSEIDFNRADICNSEGVVPNIASIQNVAGEQVFHLKVELLCQKNGNISIWVQSQRLLGHHRYSH